MGTPNLPEATVQQRIRCRLQLRRRTSDTYRIETLQAASICVGWRKGLKALLAATEQAIPAAVDQVVQPADFGLRAEFMKMGPRSTSMV